MTTNLKSGIHAPRMPKHLPSASTGELSAGGEYAQVLLSNEDLTGLSAANLLFEQVHLRQIIFQQTRLPGLRLLDSRLERCDLSGASGEKARFRRVEFRGCRLSGINFIEASFEDLLFYDCMAVGANFSLATFKAARFEKCVLREAQFDGTDLPEVVFDQCDLTQADFRNANLKGADLRTSTINGLQAGIRELQGVIIQPVQAVQVVNLLGVIVRESDE